MAATGKARSNQRSREKRQPGDSDVMVQGVGPKGKISGERLRNWIFLKKILIIISPEGKKAGPLTFGCE